MTRLPKARGYVIYQMAYARRPSLGSRAARHVVGESNVNHDDCAEHHAANPLATLLRAVFARSVGCCCAALASSETVNRDGQRFLNCLPDLLFVCTRVILRRNGDPEVLWTQK